MKKFRLQSGVCAFLLSMVAMPTFASVIYSYTGDNFTNFSNPATYDNTMRVSVIFELNTFLSPNMDFSSSPSISPTSFSILDGINTLTENNTTYHTFRFATDGNGNITEWDIEATDSERPFSYLSQFAQIESYYNLRDGRLYQGDHGSIRTCLTESCAGADGATSDYGTVYSTVGEWTVEAVPIPSAIWLFGTGLLGLVGIARRKKA